MRTYLSDPRVVWPETTSVRSRLTGYSRQCVRRRLRSAEISDGAPRRPSGRRSTPGAWCVRRLTPDVIATPVVMHNMLGIIEGRQPSSEMVVVGAHLDHDGVDEAGRIYNGADDNASGTAAVLAIAAAFARAAASGRRPCPRCRLRAVERRGKGRARRRVLRRGPVPARRVVANLNLDMVGREEEILDPDDPRFQGFARTSRRQNTNVVHLLGYSYSPDLAATVQQANDTIRLTIKEDYDRDSQKLLRRSDNWPFLEHGIPAVFLTTGLHPDYHTPADDTDRIDFAKLERITELACRAALDDGGRRHGPAQIEVT